MSFIPGPIVKHTMRYMEKNSLPAWDYNNLVPVWDFISICRPTWDSKPVRDCCKFGALWMFHPCNASRPARYANWKLMLCCDIGINNNVCFYVFIFIGTFSWVFRFPHVSFMLFYYELFFAFIHFAANLYQMRFRAGTRFIWTYFELDLRMER